LPARHAPAVSSFKAKNPPSLCYLRADEKLQRIKRLPAPIIRHLLARHRTNELSAVAAARELDLSRARFYKLYSQYLRACAQGLAEVWSPAFPAAIIIPLGQQT
jgi:hypothetical protein